MRTSPNWGAFEDGGRARPLAPAARPALTAHAHAPCRWPERLVREHERSGGRVLGLEGPKRLFLDIPALALAYMQAAALG